MVNNKFVLGVILAIVCIAAYVIMALSSNPDIEAARGVMIFATPFIVALLGGGVVDKLTNGQDEIKQKVTTVEHQTNGALTARLDQQTADLKLHTNEQINKVLNDVKEKERPLYLNAIAEATKESVALEVEKRLQSLEHNQGKTEEVAQSLGAHREVTENGDSTESPSHVQ